MDVDDDDDDGLGVGQGGEDPIIGKVPATPLLVARNNLWRRTSCRAEPPGQPGHVRTRQVGVDTPKPNPVDRAVRATRPVFMQVTGPRCDPVDVAGSQLRSPGSG